jgi:hypothetical protein
LDLQQLKEQFDGKRVKYVGIRGATDGPVGKVWRVTKGGVWVSLADGSRQQWHPEDISLSSRNPLTLLLAGKSTRAPLPATS